MRVLRYFSLISTGRMVLWCYAVWYVVIVARYFDPALRLWMTSLGLSAIIGIALILSTRPAGEKSAPVDHWQTFRLFLMPFCVSSFAALVKDEGFILIFPPSLRENLIAGGAVALFLLLQSGLRCRKW